MKSMIKNPLNFKVTNKTEYGRKIAGKWQLLRLNFVIVVNSGTSINL